MPCQYTLTSNKRRTFTIETFCLTSLPNFSERRQWRLQHTNFVTQRTLSHLIFTRALYALSMRSHVYTQYA